MASVGFVKDALKVVQDAEDEFRQRWTQIDLEQAEPAFADLLKRQRALFDKACVTGTSDAVIRHRDGMVRGYQKAMQIMQGVKQGEGGVRVYQGESGRRIAITPEKVAEADRVKGVVYLTTGEAAALLDRFKAFDGVVEVKARWPGAEVLPGEKRVNGVNGVNEVNQGLVPWEGD